MKIKGIIHKILPKKIKSKDGSKEWIKYIVWLEGDKRAFEIWNTLPQEFQKGDEVEFSYEEKMNGQFTNYTISVPKQSDILNEMNKKIDKILEGQKLVYDIINNGKPSPN